jgi:hypothetical protein
MFLIRSREDSVDSGLGVVGPSARQFIYMANGIVNDRTLVDARANNVMSLVGEIVDQFL